MDIGRLFLLGERFGDQLAARGETVAVAESSAGGLVSAALPARCGASAYFFGGAVLYTRRSRRLPTTLTSEDTAGRRSSSLPRHIDLCTSAQICDSPGLSGIGAIGLSGTGWQVSRRPR